MGKWTIDTLREHLAELREADWKRLDERHQAQLQAIEEATRLPRQNDIESGRVGATGMKQNVAVGIAAVAVLVSIIGLIFTLTK